MELESTSEYWQRMMNTKMKMVSSFDGKSKNKLISLIIDDVSRYAALEMEIEEAYNKLVFNEEHKDQLLYQRELTGKEIIDENAVKMYLIYSAVVGLTWASSADMWAFIQHFLVCFGIGASSFVVNLKYFTSDLHKQQIDIKVTKIDEEMVACQKQIDVLEKQRRECVQMLRCEVDKLYDIFQRRRRSYEGIDRLLRELKMDFLIREFVPKKRTKSK